MVCAALLCACGKSGTEETTCQVKEIGGVPRIVLNGKPVRARMLYVSPLYFPMGSPIYRTAHAEITETFVEIAPLKKSVENAAIEFKAWGEFDCEIYSLEVSEADGGKKIFKLDENTPMAKSGSKSAETEFKRDGEKQLRIKSAGGLAKISFGGCNLEARKKYRIDIKIKAQKKFDFNLYTTVNGEFFEPKKRSFVGLQTKLAKEAGVDFVTFPVQAADFMPEDGKSYSTENIKGALDEILAANPDAKILVRVRCYPPEWWMKKYPQDALQYVDGKVCDKYPGAGSPFSPRFREDSAKALAAIIDFCENYCGKNIVGYHPGGANSCEWFYPDTGNTPWVGYEESAQKSWRKWLAEKYKTDSALQKAWNDKSATLANAQVPTPEERLSAFCIVNPKTQTRLFDCNMFRQDSMVETMLSLSKVVRKKVPRKLSAIFYGYITIAEKKGSANPGHFGLGKVLKSPDVDIICGPVSYGDSRNLGRGSMTPSTTESITRAGKIWITEDDIRTHRVPPTQQQITKLGSELRTLEDTLSVLQRDMAQQAIRNNGNWWMDLGGTGWFDDPKLWTLMPKFAALENDMIENPLPYHPDIALVMDERSVCFGGANGTNLRTMLICGKARTDLTDCAVSYGNFLLDDFLFGKPYSPKLAIFTVSCALDAKQRKAMREKTANTSAVFVWSTGLIDADKNEFSLAAVKEATGFDAEYADETLPMLIFSTDEGKKIGLSPTYGTAQKTSPLLTPRIKDGDKILGRYKNGQPAIVLRGKHLFSGSGIVPIPLYKHMIAVAGVREYSKQKLCAFANGAYVSVTCTDGESAPHGVALNVHSDKEIFDALTGERLGKGPHITLKMKRGDNRILRLGKGNRDFVK